MLQNVLKLLGVSQEFIAEKASVHRSTISRCLKSPEVMHPDMIKQIADSIPSHTEPILRWYCTECCAIGKNRQHEYREISLSEATCGLFGSIELLKNRLSRLIIMASDNRVDESEWKEFMDILSEAQNTEQSIIDLEVWVSAELGKEKTACSQQTV